MNEKKLELRELGAPIDGVPQAVDRRLFFQLHVLSGVKNVEELIEELGENALEAVLYLNLSDPNGVGLLLISEDASEIIEQSNRLFATPIFNSLRRIPEMTMIGKTYSSGREVELEDWLLHRPRRNAMNSDFPWAIWYPLRRKPEFYLLSRQEQGKVLREHGMLGKSYVEQGYANDIRLSCFGLDRDDNEFLIGLVGPELNPLSRLVQEMRKTEHTAKYIASLGPFFVGKVCWKSG